VERLSPELKARVRPEDWADAHATGSYGGYFAGSLLDSGGMGSALESAGMSDGGPLPVLFGDLRDDPRDGDPPGWEVWQNTLPSDQVPADVYERLPPDVQARVTPVATSGTTGLGAGAGGTGSTQGPAGGGGGIGDPPVAPGPWPSPLEDPGAGSTIAGIDDLVRAAPAVQQAADNFDQATNDTTIRSAEEEAAQLAFSQAFEIWLQKDAVYQAALAALGACEDACATGTQPCGCDAELAAHDLARQEILEAEIRVNLMKERLTEAQIAADLARGRLANADTLYRNSRLGGDRDGDRR
jgi:hypothetical protein